MTGKKYSAHKRMRLSLHLDGWTIIRYNNMRIRAHVRNGNSQRCR